MVVHFFDFKLVVLELNSVSDSVPEGRVATLVLVLVLA